MRQRIVPGAILEIKVEEYFHYAQILQSKGCAFFDIQLNEALKDYSILQDLPVLFILRVYDDVIKKGTWIKVEKMKIRNDLKVEPFKFIQDALNPSSFEIYDPNTGETKSATLEQVKDLECAAVWEAKHVEDRLKDHYNGKTNIWLEQLAIRST